MKHGCVIAPRKGADVFFKLKKQLGRELAQNLWNDIASHQDFISDNKGTLVLTDEGIPTYESLMANKTVQEYLGKEQMRKIAESNFTQLDNTPDNFSIAVTQAHSYNQQHKNDSDFVAFAEREGDKVIVKMLDKTPNNVQKSIDQFGINHLNSTINTILQDIGITPGQIEEAGINGITDFSRAQKLGEDIIAVANNVQGDYALSEEFSHLCLEVFKDNPLIDRIKAVISNNPALVDELLGEDYAAYEEKYQGDYERLVDEAMGHLLQDSFFRGTDIKQAESLFDRLVSSIKKKFKGVDSEKLQQALIEARTMMDSVAKDILSGNLQLTRKNVSAVNRDDVLYSLSQAEEAIKILEKALDNEVKMQSIIGSEDRTFADELLTYSDSDNDTALGIMKFTQHALKELENLNQNFGEAIDMHMDIKFSYLRKVNNYLNMYKKHFADIQKLLARAQAEDDELNLLSRSFDVGGVNIGTLRRALDSAVGVIAQLEGKYNAIATKNVAAFFEPFLGKNITNPFKEGSEALNIIDMLQGREGDISWWDKMLTSMSESSDALLQMFDQAAKKAKDAARMKTIAQTKEIQSAYNKAKNAGVTDFTFMYAKDKDGNRTNLYITSAEASKLSQAEQDFYNTFMSIKANLDELLDDKQATLSHVIQIKKEHTYGALSYLAKGQFKELGEYFKNMAFERDYDDQQGYNRHTLVGFDGKEYRLVPKYYLHDVASQEDVSDDPLGSLIAYAYMANNYKEMDDIVDALETGRDILKNRAVTEKRGDTKVQQTLNWMGFSFGDDVTMQWESTNAAEKLEYFFNSQVYGRYIKDEGVWNVGGKNISSSKITNTLLGWGSHIQLGCNWLANVANIVNGAAMVNIEAGAGKFFKAKTLAKADGIYSKELGAYLAELPNMVKTSKLALLEEYFDTKQGFNKDVKKVYNKNLLKRIFGPSLAFVGQEMGDHWLYNRVAISMLLETPCEYTDAEGNTIQTNAYEALEVVKDENGVATLKFKGDNVKFPTLNLDNAVSPFTALGRAMANVNQKLFGVYNQDDAVAAQQLCLGRLALQYRKWMAPAFNKRFQGAQYNSTLDTWEEGYYRTAGRFALNVLKDLKRGQFQLASRWNDIKQNHPEQYENLRRALTECGQYALLLGCIMAIGYGWKGKERPWLIKLTEYQLKRQKTEMGALIPGPTMVKELYKILDSPMAAMSTMNNIIQMWDALSDPFGHVRQSGTYQGMNNIEVSIYKNTPYIKSVKRFTSDIDDAISFFNKSN